MMEIKLEEALSGPSNTETVHDANTDGKNSVLLGETRLLSNALQSGYSLSASFGRFYQAYLKQSFREQLLMLGLFLAFVVIGYLALRWVPLQSVLTEESKRLDERIKDLNELTLPTIKGEGAEAVQSRINKLRGDQAQLMKSMRPLLKQWVALDNPALLEQHKLAISSLAKQSGLEIIANRPHVLVGDADVNRTLGVALSDHSLALVENHDRLAFKYEMRGSYSSLRAFMAGLTGLAYKASFGHFDISVHDPRTETGREYLNISWVLVL